MQSPVTAQRIRLLLRAFVGLGLLALSCRAPRAEHFAASSPQAGASRAEMRAWLEQVSGRTPRGFMTIDFGRGRDERAISVVVNEQVALDLVSQMREVVPEGWLVFAGTNRWLGAEDFRDQVEVVLAQGSDPFDILRLAQTDAVNQGMLTDDLIERLKSYDAKVGLEILQASTDTVVARMQRLPPDLVSFARDVYEFCPDIVDQGVGTVEALSEQIGQSRTLFLWWD